MDEGLDLEPAAPPHSAVGGQGFRLLKGPRAGVSGTKGLLSIMQRTERFFFLSQVTFT